MPFEIDEEVWLNALENTNINIDVKSQTMLASSSRKVAGFCKIINEQKYIKTPHFNMFCLNWAAYVSTGTDDISATFAFISEDKVHVNWRKTLKPKGQTSEQRDSNNSGRRFWLKSPTHELDIQLSIKIKRCWKWDNYPPKLIWKGCSVWSLNDAMFLCNKNM